VAERTPLLEGKSMHITMASLHKPKAHEAASPRHAETAEEKTEPVTPPAPPAPRPEPTRATTKAPASVQAPVEPPAEAPAPIEAPVAAAVRTETKKINESTPAPEPVTSGE
jgi:hypothetical protein